jgi:hypothetical protein
MVLNIPTSILENSDRNASFRALKSWMEEQNAPVANGIEHAFSSGSSNVDEILQGGYAPGKITEVVEPLPSCGAQSLIHAAIQNARNQLKFVALVDTFNQFDPQSESDDSLESLLWVRCDKMKLAIKACDILVRDGNFALLILDMRPRPGNRVGYIQPQMWYRIQRTCEQSQLPFLVFSHESQVPCAFQRIQLNQTFDLDYIDHPSIDPLEHISCESLKCAMHAPSIQKKSKTAMG